jgi:hypothetical protein
LTRRLREIPLQRFHSIIIGSYLGGWSGSKMRNVAADLSIRESWLTAFAG